MNKEQATILNFDVPRHGGTVFPSDLDVLNPLLSGLKNYKIEEGIAPESIEIRGPNGANFEQLLAKGTKFMDALLFLGMSMKDEKQKIFKKSTIDAPIPVPLARIDNVPACLLVLYISRGSLPSLSDTSNLARFISISLKHGDYNPKDTGEFANSVASFDMSRMKLDRIFSMSLDIPELTIKNRMLLGVAGHKPLKVAGALSESLLHEGSDKEEKAIKLAKFLAVKADNKYKNLHPSHQTVAGDPRFKDFYRNCLCSIYIALGGNKEALKKMRSTNMFKADKFVTDEGDSNITTFVPTFSKWELKDLDEAFGEPWKMFKDTKKIMSFDQGMSKPK
jgi:hypothetical protein